LFCAFCARDSFTDFEITLFQATQKRIGESKVIAARAEVDAAKLMRQAADVSLHYLTDKVLS
jgi:hypothetical protein